MGKPAAPIDLISDSDTALAALNQDENDL